MRRFILLAFIGVFLTKNVASLKSQRYPSRLAWLFGLNNKNVHENKEEPPTVCQSQECEKFAQIISDSMDKSVDPCDNFYEYACGNWLKHNPIPEGESSWGTFHKAQENVEQQIIESLEEGPKNNDLLAVKLAKKWYETCMDTDTMDRQGPQPLVFTLFRIGGWPMIMDPDEWNEEEYSWQKVDDQYMRLTGKNTFYDVSVSEYDFNETARIHISTPHLPPGSYLLWSGTSYNSEEEDKSDEDLSDEEKHSGEQKNSQEPGSDEKPDKKSDEKGDNKDDDKDDNKVDNTNDDEDDNDDDDDDDDDDNDDDDDDDTNEQDDDENVKKKVGKKKIGKFANRKNKKLKHSRKSGTHSKKHESYMTKKQRVKRRAIPNTNVREKLHARKNERNARKARTEKLKKTLEATTPRISTEETIDKDEEVMMRSYADYVLNVARVLAKARGIEVSEEHMEKDIQDMIAFQIKLTDLTMESDDDLEITLNDFQEWYNEKEHEIDHSTIDWLYKMGELFDEAHVPIHEDLNLKVKSPDYIEGLISLLDKTSSRTIVNYIHWNFLSRIIKTSTSDMRKLYNAWENLDDDDEDDKKDDQKDDNKARMSQCISDVEMSEILAYEYVRKHYSDEISQTASDMIDDIQKEVEYLIKKSDWMDEDTKDFILAKLVNMDRFIGYPDWYKNNTVVKRYYQGLIIGNSYYENTLSYNRYTMWKKLRQLINEENDEIWSMSPIMINAFFSPDDNAMALSAADFQSPLFAYGRPQAINYGIIGSMMAHEVNHGFDNEGHLYDKKGELVEWLSAMAEAYGKRAHCFVEQFNNYPLDKNSNFTIKNYGNQTVGDNIADTMGLQAAYRAYQRRERECGKPNAVLPGHEKLTNDQLFFLSFANLWCGTEDKTRLKLDMHSPGRLRVIGSVSNSEDFAEVYNCPAGSPMNPEKKCNIWK